jgi:hypothetical protein
MAHIHAGIVQDEITNIDEMAVEEERMDGFGQIGSSRLAMISHGSSGRA